MYTQVFLLVWLLGSVTMMGCTSQAVYNDDAPRPNIIFILSDDVGWNEPVFNGGPADITPNLGRMVDEGLKLTQFYTHAVCAPTRSAFLTGRYSFRTWTDWRSEDYGKPTYLAKLGMELATNAEGDKTRRIVGMDTDERTLAEALRDAGYTTALMGKWHLGEWLDEHLPMGQGFDHQYGHYGWGIDYTNFTIPHNAPATFAVYDWHRDQEPLHEQGYATDLIANEVVRHIAAHREEEDATGDKQPFFYYVPFNAIHGPLESIPRYTNTLDKRMAALKCLDDAVGRIVAAVDQYGYGEDTLIVFTNDNGGLRPEHSAPYRGTKNTTYEGGVRVPCVLRWTGTIDPKTANDEMMFIADFYSTFIARGGADAKQDRPVDGMDMTDTIFAGKPSPRDEIIFDVAGCVRLPTIRKGDLKLMGEELYNIKEDPYEKKDLAKAYPEIVSALKKRLAEAAAERPPLPRMDLLMSPAQPWVYGEKSNANVPDWVKRAVMEVRKTQPEEWAEGKTPWPQAPKDGKIIYTGDGR
ncbi:MAG: sulfatase-like hydrolase/transferase [Planctomycetota bacterium]